MLPQAQRERILQSRQRFCLQRRCCRTISPCAHKLFQRRLVRHVSLASRSQSQRHRRSRKHLCLMRCRCSLESTFPLSSRSRHRRPSLLQLLPFHLRQQGQQRLHHTLRSRLGSQWPSCKSSFPSLAFVQGSSLPSPPRLLGLGSSRSQ